MSIDDDGGAQPEDVAVARHRTLLAALEGDQPMDWATWTLPIFDAECLTSRGREAARWAADVLRRAFGEDFLKQAWDYQRTRSPVQLWEHPTIHPVFNQGVWPLMNSAPWALANLLQLAAQLELFRAISRPVRTSMKDYRDPVKWIHGLLQLEVASLGLRAGWQPMFEPPLGTGRNADVRLNGPSSYALVEVRSLRMWQRESKAMALASEVSGRLAFGLRDIAFRLGVEVSGTVENPLTLEEVEGWLREAEVGMAATARDGLVRDVTGPTEGLLHITRERPVDLAGLTITGPQVSSDIWGVLAHRLAEKAEQAEGSQQPVWVRLEEHVGLWFALGQSHPSLQDKLALLAPIVRHMLEPYPCLAGVILAPATLWAGGIEPDHLHETIIGPDAGAAAVRSSVPPHRARETIIVARTSTADSHLEEFVRWYEDEAGWLDWALAQSDFPPCRELLQNSTTET